MTDLPSLSFEKLFKESVWAELNKVHTAVPAMVDKYDAESVTIEALPLLNKVYKDGHVIKFEKPIVQVPVCFPRTKRFRFTFPLERGDGVLLLFSENCIDDWIKSGEAVSPTSFRKFSMTDAIAIPGLFAIGKGSQISSKNKMEIVFDDIEITSDGKKISMKGDVEVTGKLTTTGDVVAGLTKASLEGLTTGGYIAGPYPVTKAGV